MCDKNLPISANNNRANHAIEPTCTSGSSPPAAKAKKSGRKSQMTITGGIVGAGVVKPNEAHPLSHLDATERFGAALLALGTIYRETTSQTFPILK